MLTTSIPPLDDGHQARYLGPWHVQILADGRVLAAVLLVVGDDLRPDPDRTRVLLFVHRDGRWLVDETIASVLVADCALPVEVAAVVGPPPGSLVRLLVGVMRPARCRSARWISALFGARRCRSDARRCHASLPGYRFAAGSRVFCVQ